MDFIELGVSGVRVSRVVFGAMSFGEQSDSARVRTLHAALALGMSSVDTAPLYGFGRSEQWVGAAIAGRRAAVQVLTKVGLSWDDSHGEVLFEFEDDAGRPRAVRKDSRPKKIRLEVEASLQRLGTDFIDLIQVHHLDPSTPVQETLGELERLRAEGKVRAIGVSNYPLTALDEAHAALGAGLVSDQCEFNLLTRTVERDVIPWCRQRGVAVLAYSPLAQGLLAGRTLGRAMPADWRAGGALFQPKNLEQIAQLLRVSVAPIATRHGVTLGEVALGWLLSQSGVTAVIAGASSEAQTESNARAADLRLEPPELESLSGAFGAFRPAPSAGARGKRLLKGLARRLRAVF